MARPKQKRDMEDVAGGSLYYHDIVWVVPPILAPVGKTKIGVSPLKLMSRDDEVGLSIARLATDLGANILIMDVADMDANNQFPSAAFIEEFSEEVKNLIPRLKSPVVVWVNVEPAGLQHLMLLAAAIKSRTMLPMIIIKVPKPGRFYTKHHKIFEHVIGMGNFRYHLESILSGGGKGPRYGTEDIYSP